jgi:hypothetical protein
LGSTSLIQVTNVADSATNCGTSFGGAAQFMSLGAFFLSRPDADPPLTVPAI